MYKKFEKVNANNVTLVKGAIKNGYSVITFIDSDSVIDNPNDIYSLYDHDNLFIFKYEDIFKVGLLKSFVMKDKEHVVVRANTPNKEYLINQIRLMRSPDEASMIDKVSKIYEKCSDYQKELDSNKKPKTPSDIFDAFNFDSEIIVDEAKKDFKTIEDAIKGTRFEWIKDHGHTPRTIGDWMQFMGEFENKVDPNIFKRLNDHFDINGEKYNTDEDVNRTRTLIQDIFKEFAKANNK